MHVCRLLSSAQVWGSYAFAHWALCISLQLGVIEAQQFQLRLELEAQVRGSDVVLLFSNDPKWSFRCITGNPHTNRPLINQSSCTGEHIWRSSDRVWQGRDPGPNIQTTRPHIWILMSSLCSFFFHISLLLIFIIITLASCLKTH
jgi:hypothetical protein